VTQQFVLGVCYFWILSNSMEHSPSSAGNIRSATQEIAPILLLFFYLTD
jgi:hypothetical protein